MTGRNNTTKKRLGATASLFMILGAAMLAAAPAGAISLGGAGGGGEGSEGSSEGSGSGGLAGSAETTVEAVAGVDANPPDPQPIVDETVAAALAAKAEAEAQANALLAQKDALAGAAALDWAVQGAGAGKYDIILGVSYLAGLDGTATAHKDAQATQTVDVGGHAAVANDAVADVEGQLNALIDEVNALYQKAHASLYLGTGGVLEAIGSVEVGADLLGMFGLSHSAKVVDVSQALMGLDQRVDVAGPPLKIDHVDLPEVEIPDLAVDQSGELAADAAATAEGIIDA